MRTVLSLFILCLMVTPVASAAAEVVAAEPDSVQTPKPDAILTLAEVVGLNTLIWSFDRYIREGGTNPGFRIGINSMKENIRNGFEWDDNQFSTNQFSHPYHGNLYFNSARANGFDFWESMPFVFLGSFMWEYFYEVHHPSLNDWAATSLGGIALGETTRRISSLILTTDSGKPGFWNETGAFLVNPMRGFNRLFFPRSDQDHFESRPSHLSTYLEYGGRRIGEGKIADTDAMRGFLHYGFRYGDPFAEDCEKPFDFFNFDIQMNFAESSFIGGVAVSGLLAGHDLDESEKSQQMLGAFLNYAYYSNSAYEFGGQSIGGAFMSRRSLSDSFDLHTKLGANLLVLGATASDYLTFTGREYDYGPGAGLELVGSLLYKKRQFFTVAHTNYWMHILNGNNGNHLISATAVGLRAPISPRYDVGLMYLLYLADRRYAEYPTVHARYPEIRASVRLNYF